MALKTQQDLMIRLCLDKEVLFLFSNLRNFRNLLSESINEPLFKDLDLSGVSYQANAIDVLLLNDLKANLTETFSEEKLINDLERFYSGYRMIFPFRLKNKFEEYIRFLGFLLYKTTGEERCSELRELIKSDYSAFACTLKRERLIDEFKYIKARQGKSSRYIVNPTAISTSFIKSTRSGKKKFFKVFFYQLNDAQISMAEINKKLYDFIELNRLVLIPELEIISKLKLNLTDNLESDTIVESGLLIKI